MLLSSNTDFVCRNVANNSHFELYYTKNIYKLPPFCWLLFVLSWTAQFQLGAVINVVFINCPEPKWMFYSEGRLLKMNSLDSIFTVLSCSEEHFIKCNNRTVLFHFASTHNSKVRVIISCSARIDVYSFIRTGTGLIWSRRRAMKRCLPLLSGGIFSEETQRDETHTHARAHTLMTDMGATGYRN